MKNLICLFLLLFLFACGETSDATDESAAMDTDTNTETTVADRQAEGTFLEQTLTVIRAAGGDPTAIDQDAAANNVNGWITQLSGVDGTEAVLADLALLKKEFILAEDDAELNRQNISAILSSLADNTRALSDRATGLSTLADALETGAERLAVVE